MALLSAASPGIKFADVKPTVVLVAGVNGSGKTTSIAKLAKRLKDDGKKVMVAACDTFRAAAVEQLTIWSQRIGCDIVKAQQGSDPAAVAHDACEKAKARAFDVLIVDTAGRLHTQAHLMKELEKIRRIVAKQIDGAPHEVLLVLDATTGQNAVVQAEQFSKAIQCTGVILAKLDGTAKGGAIFGVKQKLNLPVKFVGVGETLDDLEPFDPEAYVRALFE
jgi:fused signal recognition particle receptor